MISLKQSSVFLDLLSTGTFSIRSLGPFLRNVPQGSRHLYRELDFKKLKNAVWGGVAQWTRCLAEDLGSVSVTHMAWQFRVIWYPLTPQAPGMHVSHIHARAQAEHSGIT